MMRFSSPFILAAAVTTTCGAQDTDGGDARCVLSAQVHGMPFYKKNETSCFQSPHPVEDFDATPTYPAVPQPVRWSIDPSDGDDATAISNFQGSAVAGIQKDVPADFASLFTISAPAATGACVDAVTGPDQLATILADAKVTTDNPNYAAMLQQMPLLFDATTGGTMEIVSFALLNPATGEYQITIGGVQPTGNNTFRVQVLDGTVSGDIVQQQKDDHECYHCFLWVVCCDDNWYNVADTTAQLDDIQAGSQHALAAFWSSASYPIGSCLSLQEAELDHKPEPEPKPNLQLAYLDADPATIFEFVIPQWYAPNSSADFDVLLEQEKALVNSWPIEHLLHRNSSNPFVQTFQKEITNMYGNGDSIKLSGIPIPRLDLVMSTMIEDQKLAEDMTRTINDSFVNQPSGDVWVQFTTMQSNATTGSAAINTVFVYPLEKDEHGYVTSMDMVVVITDFKVETDGVDIKIQMHKDKHGKLVPVVNITHVPSNASGADQQQIIALAEYLTAEMVIHVLTPTLTSKSALPFHLAAYQLKRDALQNGGMIEIPREYFLTTDFDIVDALPLDAKLRDSLKNFLDLTNAAISTIKAIGSFIHSSSTTSTMISGPGFSGLKTHSDAIKLSGIMVDPNDPNTGAKFCTILLSDFNSTDQDECTKRIWVLAQETGDAPGVWQSVVHAANLTATGVIGGRIYHLTITPNVNGTDSTQPQPHDFVWVVYTYSFDFTGGVELVTTTTSWFGGFFGSQHHEVIHLPPVWTSQDAQNMDTFLQAILMNRICMLNLGPSSPQCPEPAFPKPGATKTSTALKP